MRTVLGKRYALDISRIFAMAILTSFDILVLSVAFSIYTSSQIPMG